MKNALLLWLAAAMICVRAAAALPAQGYVIIVNSANPASVLPRDEVAKMMLKKWQKWPIEGGGTVMPIDFADPAVKESYAEAIHGKPAEALRAYWQQQLFGGKEVPPPEMTSERDVVNFVRANPTAIGYVSTAADLGKGVKVLRVR